MIKRYVGIFCLLAMGLGVTPAVWAQGIPVYDNAAFMQWMLQIKGMADDLIEQKKMVDSQTKSLGSSLNTDQSGALQDAMNAVKRGSAMSGGSGQIARQLESAYGTNMGDNKAAPDYSTVMRTTKDTVRGAATQAGMQQDALNSEAKRFNDLGAQSQSASGVLEVQQAGNQINMEMVQQIQKMRAQQLAQDQANNAALLQRQQEQESKAAVGNLFFLGK